MKYLLESLTLALSIVFRKPVPWAKWYQRITPSQAWQVARIVWNTQLGGKRLNFIDVLIQETKARRKRDAERWNKMDESICQVCGRKGNDRRTLLINCGYVLSEVSDQFVDLYYVREDLKSFFGVRICKGCRAMFMKKLGEWIKGMGRKADYHLDDQGLYGYSTEEWDETNRQLESNKE